MNLLPYFLLLLTHTCLAGETNQKKTYHLRILHNNDLHSKFAETDENSAPCPKDYVDKKKCFGGFARMKWAADKARGRKTPDDKIIPSVFLNAGDNFSGTPYYDMFKWKIVAKFMDLLKLDAMTLGNHEFDGGIEDLEKFLDVIQTPIVCANLDKTNEQRLEKQKLTRSIVLKRNFDGEEIKIGVVGYLTQDVNEKKRGNLKITKIIPAIRTEARRLRKEEKVKFIIALGHLGFDKDIKIAKAVKEINLIVGGDSHTLLYTPKNKPPSVEEVSAEYPYVVMVKKSEKDFEDKDEEENKDEADQGEDETDKDEFEEDKDKESEDEGEEVMVPVVQAYAYGKYLGILEVKFDDNGNVIEATGESLLLDSNVGKDAGIEAELTKWTDDLIKEIPDFKDVTGHTRTFLKKPSYNEGKFESNFANFITDAFVDYSLQLAHDENKETWTATPISFFPGGGIRIDIANDRSKGALTVEDLMTIMPFQNDMYELTVRGSTIRKFLELSIKLFNKDEYEFEGKHYIHFSGLVVEFDLTKPADGRVVSVDVLCRECKIPEFQALKDDADYGIITPITEAKKFKRIQTENQTNDLVEAYREKKLNFKDILPVKKFLQKKEVVAPVLDKRVKVTGFELKKRASSEVTKKESNITIEAKPVENE